MKTSVFLTALVLGVGVFAVAGWAGPEPAVSSTKWQLDFEFHDPQRISLPLPGDDHDTTYWYLLYTATNNTGKDAQFYPSVELVTSSLQTVEAGANIPPRVFDHIKARHVKEYPFIAPQRKVTGPLLQGKGNARTTAAIFEMFDTEANQFTVYVSGLSGEIARVANPAFDRSQPKSEDNPRFFILRRTLAITYHLPGDAKSRKQARPVRVKREWVMR